MVLQPDKFSLTRSVNINTNGDDVKNDDNK